MLQSHRSQIALFIIDKASIEVLEEYAEYADKFFEEVAVELPKYMKINNHLNDLKKGKQLSDGTIYSLGPVKLDTLKTYIRNNFKNGFIRELKSFAGVPILLIKKANGFPHLCVDF